MTLCPHCKLPIPSPKRVMNEVQRKAHAERQRRYRAQQSGHSVEQPDNVSTIDMSDLARYLDSAKKP